MAEEKSEIGKLDEKLYSRTRYHEPMDRRTPVGAVESPPVEEKWRSPELDELLRHERETMAAHPVIKKIFAAALLFFVLTVGVAGYVFLGGANFISSKNVDIAIVGPTSSSAGAVLELGLTVLNKNNADLEVANLSIDFPEGTRDPEDTLKPLPYMSEKLGEIKAGHEAVRTIRAVLFGSRGEEREIKFSIEYKVAGSNATFYKDKIFEVVIDQAPLTLSVESPDSINSGDIFTTTVNTALNAETSLKNVMLRAEYPYGFTLSDSTPAPVSEDNVWSLGDLTPVGKKTVTIRGRLLGEQGEERTFRFYLGVGEGQSIDPNFRDVIISSQNTLAIARPSLGLSTSFNNERTDTYVAPPSKTVNVSVKYRNNLTTKIINPRVEVRLSGVALDKGTVSVQNNGFYDSQTNTITWQSSNLAGLSELGPGETGQANFSFASLATLSPAASGREISVEVIFSGLPLGASAGQTISVRDTGKVRISSQINFSSYSIYSRGPFANTGPVPPKAETETTYTINLSLGNTQADIKETKVTAYLGQNVSWLQTYSQSSEDVSYDSSSNTITWDVGTLTSGSGFSLPGREVSLKIALRPSLSQVGTAPVLVGSIAFSGVDSVTDLPVMATNPDVTTRLSNDPTFIQGDDIVVE